MPDKVMTAAVKVLTAEVRVLMVGSRQVTLSVYRQLDWTGPDEIEPFGRVHDSQDDKSKVPGEVFVVGVHTSGTLARASEPPPKITIDGTDLVEISQGSQLHSGVAHDPDGRLVIVTWDRSKVRRDYGFGNGPHWRWRGGDGTADLFMAQVAEKTAEYDEAEYRYQQWKALPLIVLAGLR